MQIIGFIGLGKMGLNLARNLINAGYKVIGTDINQDYIKMLENYGGVGAEDINSLIEHLPHDQIVWIMLPSGRTTDQMIKELSYKLNPGSIVIDGGNSNFHHTLSNYQILQDKGIKLLDCGTSGGTKGALEGANLMIGGDKNSFDKVEMIFKAMSQEGGYLYTGPSGSGHYLKMVHNGIEYGMMQAIGEGFNLLEHSDFDYDYEKVCRLWNNGSVIRSWLIQLAGDAFEKNARLDDVEGVVFSSGEGKWAVQESIDLGISLPVITASLMVRYRSTEEDNFTGKVLASLRREFGGHDVKKKIE